VGAGQLVLAVQRPKSLGQRRQPGSVGPEQDGRPIEDGLGDRVAGAGGAGALDSIGPDDVLERAPLEQLSGAGELFAFRHEGFWDCMDTYKDTLLLNELWERGEAPWRALVET